MCLHVDTRWIMTRNFEARIKTCIHQNWFVNIISSVYWDVDKSRLKSEENEIVFLITIICWCDRWWWKKDEQDGSKQKSLIAFLIEFPREVRLRNRMDGDDGITRWDIINTKKNCSKFKFICSKVKLETGGEWGVKKVRKKFRPRSMKTCWNQDATDV